MTAVSRNEKSPGGMTVSSITLLQYNILLLLYCIVV